MYKVIGKCDSPLTGERTGFLEGGAPPDSAIGLFLATELMLLLLGLSDC